MKDPRPQPIHRKDYRPPDYWIDTVDLRFDLDADDTRVTAKLAIRRNANSGCEPAPLVLHGEKLELLSVELDGAPLPEDCYRIDGTSLRIPNVPERFELETVVRICPRDNTELSGLYRSGASLCTQCEAEGFRRITYFLDRPDVMARYTTTILADKQRYPVLLSNGNRIAQRELEDGRQLVIWQDPFPKPSYLFALVAADLACHRGTFTTRSNREIALEVWVEHPSIDACEHALRSLQKAMLWEEQVFGREYDLDTYMIVAVSDFNMGAMENKGLNIFNAKFVLARPETATDEDYEDIEGVIAHEYFHNWTGNRVTCRDWFQLTLKEGLTVFRDEQFTADMTSAAVKRIKDVRVLRTAQFAEDQSPTAHPIRPDAYIEMNNFYTVTVYNKGAEVIRMLHTLLGADGFRRGMDLYFERHDGQAVTCDEFRAAMADANGVDLEQFGRWYAQAGTPQVEAAGSWDEQTKTYALTLRQRPPVQADPSQYQAMHIPVAVGLIDPEGRDVPLHPTQLVIVRNTTAVLELREPEQTFSFTGIEGPVVPSVLRNFSAPVKLAVERTIDELSFLMGHDADPFSRWDAGQSLAQALLLGVAEDAAAGRALQLDTRFVEAFGRVLGDAELDGSLKALALRLPDERLLGQQQDVVNPESLHAARSFARRTLGEAHGAALRATYAAHRAPGGYRIDRTAIDGRRIKNVALGYWVATATEEAIALAQDQFEQADNMTDAEAALTMLAGVEHPARERSVDAFYRKWKHDPLVLDKWFSVQAASPCQSTLGRVVALAEHPDFNLRNPNRVRSLLGVFSIRNQVRFHSADGAGYTFLTDKLLEIDAINPQIAARLVGAFSQWRRFDASRRDKMRTELGRMVGHRGLSRDVYELASKYLVED